jgi:hypothetical protein
LSVNRNIKPDEVVDLFRKNKGSELHHLTGRQYDLLLRLVYTLLHRGKCHVWGSYDEHNQLLAGVIWAFSHQKAIFLFSAVSFHGKELSAMPWMIDQFIEEHSGSPFTLDFEGSNDDNLGRFYAGFGSRKVLYTRIFRNTLPPCLKLPFGIYRFLHSTKK